MIGGFFVCIAHTTPFSTLMSNVMQRNDGTISGVSQ